jgi:hypothetical protein
MAEDRPDPAVEAIAFPAAPIMRDMLATYQERRGTYGPSEQLFGAVMHALFPKGLRLDTPDAWTRYGLFHQIVGKLTRYAKDFNTPHVDSVHDLSVYGAMLEAEDRRLLKLPPFNLTIVPLSDQLNNDITKLERDE